MKLKERKNKTVSNTQANIAGILENSVVDGDGLRTVIFFQGCLHNCFNCHNPQSHSLDINQSYSITELVSIIKEKAFNKKITFSGGEPFLQYEVLSKLCEALNEYDIWIYTGYELAELEELGYNKIFSNISTLVTGRYVDDLRSIDSGYFGSTNQKIIKLKST